MEKTPQKDLAVSKPVVMDVGGPIVGGPIVGGAVPGLVVLCCIRK